MSKYIKSLAIFFRTSNPMICNAEAEPDQNIVPCTVSRNIACGECLFTCKPDDKFVGLSTNAFDALELLENSNE